MAEPAGGVDPRREPEPDRAGVDRGGIDARGAHERAQARRLVVRARRRRPAATRPRFSSTSGTTSATVASATRSRCRSRSRHAERLEQLVDDAGAAELRERVVGRPRRDDRAVGERVAGPVVVGDDDLEPARRAPRPPPSTAVMPQSTVSTSPQPSLGEPRERLAARRRSPPRSGSAGASRRPRRGRGARRRRARWRRCRRRRSRRGRRCAPPAAIAARIASQAALMSPSRNGSWAGSLGGEEGPRLLGVAVAPPDEDARRRLAEPERRRERLDLAAGARTHRPRALVHPKDTVRRSDGRASSCRTRVQRVCRGSVSIALS